MGSNCSSCRRSSSPFSNWRCRLQESAERRRRRRCLCNRPRQFKIRRKKPIEHCRCGCMPPCIECSGNVSPVSPRPPVPPPMTPKSLCRFTVDAYFT